MTVNNQFICGDYGSGFEVTGVLIPFTSYPSFGIRSMNGTYYLVAPAYHCGVWFNSFTIESNPTRVRLVPSPNGDTNDGRYYGDGAIALDGTTVVNDSDGNVTAYDLATGAQKWQTQVSGDLLGSRSPALLVPGTLQVYTVTSTTLYMINLSTGQIEAQVGVAGPNVASPSIGGSYLYVSTQSGLFTYDVNLQLLAFAPLVGGVSSPTMDASGRVFVSTGDGKVFLFPP